MITINNIKFGKKGVKDSTGKYYPVSYSHSHITVDFKTRESKLAVTIYAKGYSSGLPTELNPINQSDSFTDYHEKDRVRFFVGTPEYETLKTLCPNL